MIPPQPVLIRRLALRNFKSVEACQIELGPLTFVVGPNGSGKSNVLDSLRFVGESLRTSLDHALRDRGSLRSVCRWGGQTQEAFAIRLDFQLPNGSDGFHAFLVGPKAGGGFEVAVEECRITATTPAMAAYYRVEQGRVVRSNLTMAPLGAPDRLYLVAASGLPQFRPAYEALSMMEVYNLSPREIGAARDGAYNSNSLLRTGANAATVFASLASGTREEINDYLGRLLPGISAVIDPPAPIDQERPLIFQQAMLDNEFGPWRFPASSMSDGTLRAFGILLALFQDANDRSDRPRVIGIEEPELALHPAATGVLLGALHAASRKVQVIVSSHSPDLLDDPDIPLDSLVAVAARNGITRVGPITEAGRSLIREGLTTAGGLMRDNQLEPAQTEAECLREAPDFKLFELAEA